VRPPSVKCSLLPCLATLTAESYAFFPASDSVKTAVWNAANFGRMNVPVPRSSNCTGNAWPSEPVSCQLAPPDLGS